MIHTLIVNLFLIFLRNHFINLRRNFGIKIKSCNFFATLHAKSTCEGIGAVTKGSARKASLKKVKISGTQEMYNYLSNK